MTISGIDRDDEIDEREVFYLNDCIIYNISCGYMIMTNYTVFPGINLIYNDIDIHSCLTNNPICANVFSVYNYREGRIFCEYDDEFFIFLRGILL